MISRPAEGSCFCLATVTEFSIPARVPTANIDIVPGKGLEMRAHVMYYVYKVHASVIL